MGTKTIVPNAATTNAENVENMNKIVIANRGIRDPELLKSVMTNKRRAEQSYGTYGTTVSFTGGGLS